MCQLFIWWKTSTERTHTHTHHTFAKRKFKCWNTFSIFRYKIYAGNEWKETRKNLKLSNSYRWHQMFSVSLAHCPSKKQVDLYCNRQEHWISSQIVLLQISNIRHTNGGIWNTKKSRFCEVRRNYCTEQNRTVSTSSSHQYLIFYLAVPPKTSNMVWTFRGARCDSCWKKCVAPLEVFDWEAERRYWEQCQWYAHSASSHWSWQSALQSVEILLLKLMKNKNHQICGKY